MRAAEKYFLGELTEEEKSQYEEHFFDCTDCAEDVKTTARFVDAAKGVLKKTEEPRSERARAVRPPRPGLISLFWPLPAGAVAAGLAMMATTSYFALVQGPRLRHELAEASTLQASSSHFLAVSRSEPQVVRVAKNARMIELVLSQSTSRPFPFYRCDLRDAAGRVLLSGVVSPPPRDELQIFLPTQKLSSGAYVLAVSGLESASSTVSAETVQYPFTLRQEERGEDR